MDSTERDETMPASEERGLKTPEGAFFLEATKRWSVEVRVFDAKNYHTPKYGAYLVEDGDPVVIGYGFCPADAVIEMMNEANGNDVRMPVVASLAFSEIVKVAVDDIAWCMTEGQEQGAPLEAPTPPSASVPVERVHGALESLQISRTTWETCSTPVAVHSSPSYRDGRIDGIADAQHLLRALLAEARS